MLPKPNRLRRVVDVKRVQRHGCSWRHPLVILLVLTNSQPFSRFAVIASKRVGNAVVRNRCRRRLREVIRGQLPTISPGWDCVLIARQTSSQAAYLELETAVLHTLTRAQLLNEHIADQQQG
ncbi:MAG: ribonuclease P protein component [Anaerolineae bacterium]